MVTSVLLPFLTTLFAVRVERCRVAQLIFLGDVPKLQEATRRIFEGGAGRGVGVHLQCKVDDRNLCTWI